MLWVIIAAITISVGCYFIWSWADHYLFTYLGEVEIENEIQHCYMYDTLSIPARIVAFLCGVFAIGIFELTWSWIFVNLFL